MLAHYLTKNLKLNEFPRRVKCFFFLFRFHCCWITMIVIKFYKLLFLFHCYLQEYYIPMQFFFPFFHFIHSLSRLHHIFVFIFLIFVAVVAFFYWLQYYCHCVTKGLQLFSMRTRWWYICEYVCTKSKKGYTKQKQQLWLYSFLLFIFSFLVFSSFVFLLFSYFVCRLK